ncbi:MAG: replication-associated recombination protein A [Planctomycetes bacterium]|nr:replication-associated recombination protein A [Planctomycetota bacterium]
MRPRTLDEIVGQEDIVGPGKPLRRLLDKKGTPPSMIFWGPPGSGKTTLARIVASASSLPFVQFSAVTSGVKEVREAIEQARIRRREGGRPTLLFVDEIHRFNRAQQDAFLPHVEEGTIVLVGATTENPSFEVNGALLSRCRVFVLRALTPAEVRTVLDRVLAREPLAIEPEALAWIADMANGDARQALNLLEIAGTSTPAGEIVRLETVKDAAQKRIALYDRDREEHYNTVSAFIKSMRGSDPDAAVYWLARMLEAGEDPLFIARRLVIFASEDVGNADPRGLAVAVAAMQAADFVGMPEAFYALSQATTYLATAPKSNAAGMAYVAAKQDVEKAPNEPVPLHLRNAPTSFMKGLGYGKGYQYAHDYEGAVVDQEHLPEGLRGRRYYQPKEAGYEAQIRKMMQERERKRSRPTS